MNLKETDYNTTGYLYFTDYKFNGTARLCSNSLDCKEGHMKKNRLCVCLHLGSKEHRFL